MPYGQTVNLLIGINFSTMLITDADNLKYTLKNFIAKRLTCFLPAGLSRASEAKSRESAGKKVCVRLRSSAVNKKNNPENPVDPV